MAAIFVPPTAFTIASWKKNNKLQKILAHYTTFPIAVTPSSSDEAITKVNRSAPFFSSQCYRRTTPGGKLVDWVGELGQEIKGVNLLGDKFLTAADTKFVKKVKKGKKSGNGPFALVNSDIYWKVQCVAGYCVPFHIDSVGTIAQLTQGVKVWLVYDARDDDYMLSEPGGNKEGITFE